MKTSCKSRSLVVLGLGLGLALLLHAAVSVGIGGTASSGAGKEITNTIGMKLAYIPAGKFLMGSPPDESERADDEGPRHEVQISKGFHIGVHEVTQEQYEKVMGANPSYFNSKQKDAKADPRRFPVEMVSWEDAKEFCRKLSAKEGKKYRLPTEAEWEYACRAGTTTPYHFGASITMKQVNYDGHEFGGIGQKAPSVAKPTTVGSYSANNFGLFDMHGNIWELCEDWYDAKFYAKSSAVDPLNAKAGDYRVLRGGSWGNLEPGFCRSAYRDFIAPGQRSVSVGFRVVLVGS